MKKIIKRIIKTVLLLIIILVVLFSISYVFPGKMKPVDKVRLEVQTTFLKFLGENYVTDFIPYEYGEKESTHLLTYDEVALYLEQLSTGDVFFTASENYLCSELTPGDWKHSVIYIGTKSEMEEMYSPNEKLYKLVEPYYETEEEVLILDGSKEGVKIRELSALSNLSDYSFMNACIGFSINDTKEEVKKFMDFAIAQIGKGYDYDIDTDNDDTFYCSEVLYKGFLTIGINVDKKTEMLARTAVSPSDLVDYLEESNKFSEVFKIQKLNGNVIERSY